MLGGGRARYERNAPDLLGMGRRHGVANAWREAQMTIAGRKVQLLHGGQGAPLHVTWHWGPLGGFSIMRPWHNIFRPIFIAGLSMTYNLPRSPSSVFPLFTDARALPGRAGWPCAIDSQKKIREPEDMG